MQLQGSRARLKSVRGRSPSPAWRAVVATRSALVLIEGLGSRFHQVVSPRGAARTPAWRAAALASALVDVAKARALARSDRFALAPRLTLDAADLALWCMAARNDSDTSEDAVIPGVALAAEAGARLGPIGLGVPAVNAAVAAVIRRRRGHSLRLEQFSWQAMGAICGWMLTVLARRRRAALVREHREDFRARLQGAELTGLNDVVLEHEGAIDTLQRATALIELAVPDASRRSDFAGAFKAAVAEATRAHSTYLRDAVMLWQQRHNMHPDLTLAVSIMLAAEDGTVLLSATQTARFHAQLDLLEPTGRVRVGVADPVEARRPNGNRDVLVDDVRLPLPSDEVGRTWTFDAIPTAFLLNVSFLTQPTGAHRESVPWSATALPVALTLGATAWSARRADRYGIASPRIAIVVSFGTTLLYTVLSTRTMRNAHTDAGITRVPWAPSLQGYELVRTIVGEHLQSAERAGALAGTVTVILIGWALSPPPRSVRAVVAELGWVFATSVGARRLTLAIHADADEVAAAISSDDEAELTRAYQRGRGRANQTIAAALAGAFDALARRTQSLDPELRAEAERRLRTVEILLAAG